MIRALSFSNYLSPFYFFPNYFKQTSILYELNRLSTIRLIPSCYVLCDFVYNSIYCVVISIGLS